MPVVANERRRRGGSSSVIESTKPSVTVKLKMSRCSQEYIKRIRILILYSRGGVYIYTYTVIYRAQFKEGEALEDLASGSSSSRAAVGVLSHSRSKC